MTVRPRSSAAQERLYALIFALLGVLAVSLVAAIAWFLGVSSCVSDATPVPAHCESNSVRELDLLVGTLTPIALMVVGGAIAVWLNRPFSVLALAALLAGAIVVAHVLVWP